MCVYPGKVRVVAPGTTVAKARCALRIHAGLLAPVSCHRPSDPAFSSVAGGGALLVRLNIPGEAIQNRLPPLALLFDGVV